MRSKSLKFVIGITYLLAGGTQFALAQGSGAHGGDPCESRFREITQEIDKFLDRGGADQLKFPSGWDPVRYKTAMQNEIKPYLAKSAQSDVEMGCVSHPVYVNTVEKMCVWRDPILDSTITDGKKHIECFDRKYYFDGFNQDVDTNRFTPEVYRQTIHEWNSIVGVEPNTGALSDYSVSDQIRDTGDWEMKFELGIKASHPAPVTGVQYGNIQTNPDGSVTVTGISISRGNGVFPINAFVDGNYMYGVACRALGYDDFLDGPNFNLLDNNKNQISIALDQKGNFASFSSKNISYPIVKTTCYRRSELKFIVEFKIDKKNLDGSAVITDIIVKRGGQVFPVNAFVNGAYMYGVTCRVLGYDDFLDGPSFNLLSNERNNTSVAFDQNGHFSGYSSKNVSYPIVQAMCRSGKEPLIILVGGNVYRRIVPMF